MAPSGVQDLSLITDYLVTRVRMAVQNAGLAFPVTVSGSSPESVRNEPGCQLCLYLFNMALDKVGRNNPYAGVQSPPRQRPVGLELFYLLTATAGKEYVQEQHAMSVALRALGDLTFLRIGGVTEEMSFGMENESADKVGLLWQAMSSPFRLSCVFRLATAYLTPPDAIPEPSPKPTAWTVTVDPATLPFSDSGQLLGTYAAVRYQAPGGPRSHSLWPATVAPGGEFSLLGTGLNVAGITDQLFLLDATGANERNVTSWLQPAPTTQTSTRLTLRLPSTIDIDTGGAPAAGIYQLQVGNSTFRTNSVPLSIAPAITGVATPPLLNASAGQYMARGIGLIPGHTQVVIDTVALKSVTGVPDRGEFFVDVSGTTVTFRAPADLPSGQYPLRIRVNLVESHPSWWVVI